MSGKQRHIEENRAIFTECTVGQPETHCMGAWREARGNTDIGEENIGFVLAEKHHGSGEPADFRQHFIPFEGRRIATEPERKIFLFVGRKENANIPAMPGVQKYRRSRTRIGWRRVPVPVTRNAGVPVPDAEEFDANEAGRTAESQQAIDGGAEPVIEIAAELIGFVEFAKRKRRVNVRSLDAIYDEAIYDSHLTCKATDDIECQQGMTKVV